MKIIPAIDIKGGKVVRLSQGVILTETVYFDSPVDAAKEWAKFDIDLIHVVDLDGALAGRIVNFEVVKKIVKSVTKKIELGGGIRDAVTIEKVLDAGVDKVVIGTKVMDEKFLDTAVNRFKENIVAGVDARDGMVHVKGWVSKTDVSAVDLAIRIEKAGIRRINYTDISKDGMLAGPNIEAIKELLDATNIEIVASGGITTIEDIKKLKAIGNERLVGAIIGKALYEGRIDLAEAIRESKAEC